MAAPAHLASKSPSHIKSECCLSCLLQGSHSSPLLSLKHLRTHHPYTEVTALAQATTYSKRIFLSQLSIRIYT